MSPANAIVLGSGDGPTVYARVQNGGESLASGIAVGQQLYFTGSGVAAALDAGLLLDVSASAIAARKSRGHQFEVVHPDGTRERYDGWREAQMRARIVRGRIEVAAAIEGGA
jgi:hypothetical protein